MKKARRSELWKLWANVSPRKLSANHFDMSISGIYSYHVVTFPFDKHTTQHLTRVAFMPSIFAGPRLIVIHAFDWHSGQYGETLGSWRILRGFSGLALE